jgi:N-acyl-D-amino-acid deacylase
VHDLVIRGGMVVDGTGGEPYRAAVAVDGDRITAVGDDIGSAKREVDADGLVVTPGWVDMHTHYDAQATWDPEMTPSGWHGVTTVVMGNCGVGFAPAHADRRDWHIGMMEGVEDIPGAAMAEGIQWEWETFPEYLDALERRPAVLDIATQVPHGALRAYVMGERGATDEPATADDLAEMTRLTYEALVAGAMGFSTSRTPLHRSVDGELVPGTTTDVAELFAIGEAVRRAGHGGIQLALHHPEVPQHLGWLRDLAQSMGRPVTLNLQQIDESPDLWREAVTALDDAAAAGIPLHAQVAGRPIGILMSWEGSLHPFLFRWSYRELGLDALSPDDRRARLRDDAVRAQLVAEKVEGLDGFLNSMANGFDKMWPFTGETDYEPDPNRSVAAIAASERRPPEEVAFDLLNADGGRGLLYYPIFNYAERNLDFLHELHQHPRTRMGLADAGAHCGAICDGSTPTFMVTFWTRDRVRGEHLALPHVVRRQTRETALHYGLADRGLVAPGFRADLNVIDLDALAITPPVMAYDLPTGARRYVQKSKGYVLTVCRGEVVAENSEFTGVRPGRLVRGPQAAPA